MPDSSGSKKESSEDFRTAMIESFKNTSDEDLKSEGKRKLVEQAEQELDHTDVDEKGT